MYTKPLQSEAANGARHASAERSGHVTGAALKSEFKDLITDIEELVMQTASLTGDELSLVREKLAEYDYQEVKGPFMMDKVLWERSGHWEKYAENMFVTSSENRD